MKLVDKEIVGVLQQKLVKLMVINLEKSFEAGVEKTEHWLRLLLNLLKCSPPEAEVHTQLCYRSLDSIVFELMLKARSNYFKQMIQTNSFDAFKSSPSNKGQALVKNVLKPLVFAFKESVKDFQQVMKRNLVFKGSSTWS